ncbi:MAG TPA: hypothetical protein VF054_06585 [Micromonosporaceae bacterium]
MPVNKTALYELAEQRLGQSPVRYIRAQRKADKSWNLIAHELSLMLGRTISAQTLRNWTATAANRHKRTDP